MNKNEELANYLSIIGYAVMVIGAIAGLVILVKSSEPGMFSKGELTFGAVLIAVGVFFYHVVSGIMCLGISRVLTDERVDRLVAENRRAPKQDNGTTGIFCGECGAKMSGQDKCPACGARA